MTLVHGRKAVHRKEKQGVRWFLCEPLATVEKKAKNEGSMRNKRKTKGTKARREENGETKVTKGKKK